MRTAGWLTAAVKPGGHLIVSGLLTTEEKDVSAAFSSGAVVEARETEEEWVGLTLSRAS
jgi:ribosomal protein L11 methylase PrmA